RAARRGSFPGSKNERQPVARPGCGCQATASRLSTGLGAAGVDRSRGDRARLAEQRMAFALNKTVRRGICVCPAFAREIRKFTSQANRRLLQKNSRICYIVVH
ncbi:TPA: hypothetical protein MIQ38_17665, partial [Klebsiella pneumoniae]|nr:hypothetical protein [Klebsiella pneumoniae]